MQSIITDWYLIAERFEYNYEALSHAIKDTKLIKSYMSLAHIRIGLNNGQIEQFEEALIHLMNMNISKAKHYVKKHPDKLNMIDIDKMAETLLEKIRDTQDLSSDELLSMANAVSPIGVLLNIMLSKLVAEGKYKEQ